MKITKDNCSFLVKILSKELKDIFYILDEIPF